MKLLSIVLLGLTILTMSSCNNDEVEPIFKTDLSEIISVTENDLTITLYAAEDFFVGYNSITAKIEDASGNLLSGNVSVAPIMNMEMMTHACPLEYPNGQNFTNGSFEFNSVFVMPSGEMGSWTLTFDVDGMAVKMPITVVQPEFSKLKSFVSEMNDASYFVAFIEPSAPEVGQNDIELAIYKKESMMSWPAVENLSLEIEPWMVSMDHGSPNNEAPVHVDNGHYTGKVNFTMTGDWQIRITVMEGRSKHGEPYFDLVF
ncbi:MAG: FixH family protein [Cytophagales bacterium]|nr:FixH family protein [Cytophagales bacterium]